MTRRKQNIAQRQRPVPCACCCVAMFAVGCDLPGKPNPADRPKVPDQIVGFDATVYNQLCRLPRGRRQAWSRAAAERCAVSGDHLRRRTDEGRSQWPQRHADAALRQERGGELTDEQIKVLVDGIKSTLGDGANAGPSRSPAYALTKVEGVQASPRQPRTRRGSFRAGVCRVPRPEWRPAPSTRRDPSCDQCSRPS